MTALDLTDTYLLVRGDRVEQLDGGAAFWQRLAGDSQLQTHVGEGWLTAVYPLRESWTGWEMHPEGDEIVHATAGRFRMIFDTDDGHRSIALAAGHTVVVPAGTWHTVDVDEPGATLNVTFGRGTRHRPR